jgi:hypothetical protein
VPLPEKGVEHDVAARRTVEDRGGDHRDRLHGREYSLFSRDAEEQGQIDACKELGMA